MAYLGVKKLVSGGQTGGDQGGLVAGVTLGIQTGGWAPKGWKTERGSEENLLRSFGLQEFPQWGYPPRTRANVRDSDGTVIFGNPSSRGCSLTARTANQMGRPVYTLVATNMGRDYSHHIEPFRAWLRANQIEVLNVAGNRESSMPGLAQFTHDFLVEALA